MLLEITDVCLILVFITICILMICCLSHKRDVVKLIQTNQEMTHEISEYRNALDAACGYMIELPKDKTGIRRPLKAWMNTFAFGDKVYKTEKLYLNAENNTWYVTGSYEDDFEYPDGTRAVAEKEIVAQASEVICN